MARTARAYGSANRITDWTTAATPVVVARSRTTEPTVAATIDAAMSPAMTTMNTARRRVFATRLRAFTPVNIAWIPSSTDA